MAGLEDRIPIATDTATAPGEMPKDEPPVLRARETVIDVSAEQRAHVAAEVATNPEAVIAEEVRAYQAQIGAGEQNIDFASANVHAKAAEALGIFLNEHKGVAQPPDIFKQWCRVVREAMIAQLNADDEPGSDVKYEEAGALSTAIENEVGSYEKWAADEAKNPESAKFLAWQEKARADAAAAALEKQKGELRPRIDALSKGVAALSGDFIPKGFQEKITTAQSALAAATEADIKKLGGEITGLEGEMKTLSEIATLAAAPDIISYVSEKRTALLGKLSDGSEAPANVLAELKTLAGEAQLAKETAAAGADGEASFTDSMRDTINELPLLSDDWKQTLIGLVEKLESVIASIIMKNPKYGSFLAGGVVSYEVLAGKYNWLPAQEYVYAKARLGRFGLKSDARKKLLAMNAPQAVKALQETIRTSEDATEKARLTELIGHITRTAGDDKKTRVSELIAKNKGTWDKIQPSAIEATAQVAPAPATPPAPEAKTT